MKTPVRILHLEDDPVDGELIQRSLIGAGLAVEIERVETRENYLAALARATTDLILADYNLPAFDGLAALGLAREAAPEVPFIFVSGLIGEEVALESLKTGATDYVFKHHLERLAPAVRRALQEASGRAERRRGELALRESEATLRSFFDTAPFMMGIVELLDDDVRHISDNITTARFYGTTSEAMRGRSASELGASRKTINEWIEHFREARRTGAPVQFEYSFTADKNVRWLSLTVSELPATDPGRPRFWYVAEDTTARRRLEQQFLRAQRMESIGRLASGIAHDLNNVLAPIIMSLKLLRPRLEDSKDQELLDNLESSARRGADIVRQVLTFARGAEGARNPIHLPRLIRDLEKMARDTFPRSIQIEAKVPNDLWNVVGDATQIYQVLMNLCVNARDAMPQGGLLRLTAENTIVNEGALRLHPVAQPGPYVTLAVLDTGSGIPPETLDKIFDPFFTTKDVGHGTGLGLSTVMSIVKGHHGFLTVSSEPGQGTEMKVLLPADKTTVCPSLAPVNTCAPRGHGELILVVDDDSTIRLITKAALEDHGYRVITATDGADAVAIYSRQRAEIKVVITDMMMPVMDGPATIAALKQLDPSVKGLA